MSLIVFWVIGLYLLISIGIECWVINYARKNVKSLSC